MPGIRKLNEIKATIKTEFLSYIFERPIHAITSRNRILMEMLIRKFLSIA